MILEGLLENYRLLKVYWKYIEYYDLMREFIDYRIVIENISITESLLKLYRLLQVYGNSIDYGKLLKIYLFLSLRKA